MPSTLDTVKFARLQVNADDIVADDKPPQTGQVFNSWYLKWLGGSSDRVYVQLRFRLDVQRDSGRTKAQRNSPICLFFARGCCYLGKKCPYYHRIPRDTDLIAPTKDCFGRDKTANYRDDMDGVGSFNRVNRTLFVGGINMNESTEMQISTNFGAFGRLDKVRVLPSKSCAFVTYMTDLEAQFAKEAMQCQTLGNNDVLSVRWANDDPNPEAHRIEQERTEQVTLDTVKRLLEQVDDDFDQEPSTKRVKSQVATEDADRATETLQIESAPAAGKTTFFDPTSLGTLKVIRAAKEKLNAKIREEALHLGYSSSDGE